MSGRLSFLALLFFSTCFSHPIVDEYKKTRQVKSILFSIRAGNEANAKTILEALPSAIPRNDVLQIYRALGSRSFHELILTHLFKEKEGTYLSEYYDTLAFLNEHEAIFTNILSGLNSQKKIAIHLHHLERLVKTIPISKADALKKKYLSTLEPKYKPLFEGYFYFYTNALERALKVFTNIDKGKSNPFSQVYLQDLIHISKKIYRQGEYASFLILTQYADLQQPEVTSLKQKALKYLHFNLNKGMQVKAKSEDNLLRKSFFENNYTKIIEDYADWNSVFVLYTCLAVKNTARMVDVANNLGMSDAIPLYRALLENDFRQIKASLKSYQGTSEMLYTFRDLLSNVNQPKHLSTLFLKVLIADKHLATFLSQNKSEMDSALWDFGVSSHLKNLYYAGKSQESRDYFRLHYAELKNEYMKEESLFWHGKSLEVINPKESKSVYEKLLFKNPQTHHKYAILKFIN